MPVPLELVRFQRDIVPLFDNSSRNAMMDGNMSNPDHANWNTDPANSGRPLLKVHVREIDGGAFDLCDYDQVCDRATTILGELKGRYEEPADGTPQGGMPLPATGMPPWPPAKIAIFEQWINDGMQP